MAIDIIWDILRQPHLSLAARCKVRPPQAVCIVARTGIETISRRVISKLRVPKFLQVSKKETKKELKFNDFQFFSLAKGKMFSILGSPARLDFLETKSLRK